MELTESGADAVAIPGVTPPVPVTPTPEVPEVKAEPETPAEPIPDGTPVVPVAEENLFELPDGRKVDAATLQKEWKDNFLPDYTRKSQRIAEIDRGPIKSPDESVPKWKQPDYVPENYGEIVEVATAEAERRLEAKAQAERDRVSGIQKVVDTQVAALKATDPKLDENALFLHANKYGFTDLKAAHANMVDMRTAVVTTEQRTIKNLKARDTEPIAEGGSGATSPDDGYDPTEISQFQGAGEYLARLKGGK